MVSVSAFGSQWLSTRSHSGANQLAETATSNTLPQAPGAALSEWYGHPSADLEDDERQMTASLLCLLRGDAAQRVIAVWSMGWSDAHKAAARN